MVGVKQATSANVHSGDGPTCCYARLLARSILQEYDAYTVEELATNPAEFENLAARHNLVEIAEACRRESDAYKRDGIRNCCGSC